MIEGKKMCVFLSALSKLVTASIILAANIL